MKINRDKELIVYGGAIVTVIVIILGIIIFNNKELVLKNTSFIFELGESMQIELDEIIDGRNEEIDKIIIINTTTNLNMTFDYDKGEEKISLLEYGVGEYEASIIYNGQEISFEIIVEDTTVPELVSFYDEVIIATNNSVNLENYFLAIDLSDVSISVIGDVDVTEVGTYEVNVVAWDIHGNFVERTSKIVIVDTETALRDGVSMTISKRDENGNLIASVIQQEINEDNNVEGEEVVALNSDETSESVNNENNQEIESNASLENSETNDSSNHKESIEEPVATSVITVAGVKLYYTSNDTDTCEWVIKPLGNTGLAFESESDARKWAQAQIDNKNSIYYLKGYRAWTCGCNTDGSERWTIEFN
ncbi:hypothetical protein [Breznakia pachnodae]|uniref:DUF5011 domain-containing protein n=1 Tax=Breznakia pachnodae TaxID=265178 RepID=A0ABU0E071_9FIRM|nr:hypothetical protein [Breznakia pachnodae]MDQ0360128.1 hypothetical protein [Breznakia pachnodae]